MEHRLKKAAAAAAVLMALPFMVHTAHAAAPDGMGPWADTVVSTAQGLRKDGSAVPAQRSDPTSMLGVAENDTVDGHFYSLGFGGTATLGFDNGISSGVFVVEATPPNNPSESVGVAVSEDNVHYYSAGTVSDDGTVAVPNVGLCVHYVRLTDQTNPAAFGDTADGYDVDGVMAQGNLCTRTGMMTGGGSVWKDTLRVTHGMELQCDLSKHSNLEVNWDKGNKFHLDSLSAALCTDNPSLDPGNPKAAFDTFEGWGTGSYNGKAGYTTHFVFTDNGEPGTKDSAWMEVWDPTHTTKVLDVPVAYLKNGNQQAH
jgi:hypothetical protein